MAQILGWGEMELRQDGGRGMKCLVPPGSPRSAAITRVEGH